ncbi:MAG: DNA primase [Gammaproteobacteria bacterium]
MAGRIPPEFIDQLLARIDIVDVLDKHVPLKKAGKEYQACCPFHTEKTPSFTVSRQKQFYHCFGCGAHGSAIGFLMDYDHMGFVEAVEELARDAGLEVPREQGGSSKPAEDFSRLYQLLEQASHFFQQQLRQHPQASQAVDYLRRRGLSGEIARDFGIGYAPPGWDHLFSHLAKESQDIRALQAAGLVSIADSGKPYDRFRNRIMFPIVDARGRVAGFGGRILDGDGPKYLNSPETPVFRKGEILYGLYDVRRSHAGKQQILVVEGYMDVVALAQFGIRNVVATLGTATTERHLELLFRTAPRVVFCFDGDRAGREAAWKALQTALPSMKTGREARFLFLPEGEDPDTLVRSKGADAFRELVANAPTLSGFLFEHLREQVDTSTLDGRARLADMAKPLIARIPPGSLHDLMHQELAHLTGLEMKEARADAPAPERPPRGAEIGRENSLVRHAIRLLLEEPRLALDENLPADWRSSKRKGIHLLAELIDLVRNQPDTRSSALIERWQDERLKKHLAELASTRLNIPEESYPVEFRHALERLTNQYHKELYAELIQQRSLTDEQKEQLRQLTKSKLGSQSADP